MAKDLTAEEQQYFDTEGGEAETAETKKPTELGKPEAETPDGLTPEGDKKDKPQKLVPHAALHQSREETKQYKRELEAERKARATLEDRTNLILERFAKPPEQQQQAPAGDAIPNAETDPLGFMAYQQNQVLKLVNDLAGEVQSQRTGQQQMSAVQQLQARAASMESEYRQENPEYDNASQFIRGMRDRQLRAIGITDAAQRQGMIMQEALTIANMALQNGRNPAEVVYELATNSGFAPKPAEANGDGEQPPNTAVAEAALKNLERGQRDNASLGSVRGSAPAKLTAQRLIDMGEAEFAKMMGTPEGRALMGN